MYNLVKSKTPESQIARLLVRRVPGRASEARLHAGQVVIRAAIGRNGLARSKREGDGKSPIGSFELKSGFWRSDRLERRVAGPGLKPVSPVMGWSDDPRSARYNRPITAGARESHERLWRDDHVYDVVFPTTHNQKPRIRGAGSAIFLHLARPDFAGTEGCVAISLADMRRLLPRLARRTRLIIVA
jgi:L,D-peptidoglycan transpeptidase YkuD (ErfK/YbiS/YcfS/YnhG family)